MLPDQLPLQAKIMAIADVFEALTAKDRPYKRAVPLEKALDIINFEAGKGLLDEKLVKIFLEAKKSVSGQLFLY